MFIVYQITHNITGNYYRGKTTQASWDNGYMGSGELIKKAVASDGAKAFSRKVLAMFPDEEDAYDYERLVVATNANDPKSYNISEGGRRDLSGKAISKTLNKGTGEIVNYRVLEYSDINKFRAEVRKGLRLGWKLRGYSTHQKDSCMTNSSGYQVKRSIVHRQTMVLYDGDQRPDPEEKEKSDENDGTNKTAR